MAIDKFSKYRFEEALPKRKDTGELMWEHKGFLKGEHVYTIPVREGIEIEVRSSIDESLFAANTGKDSIRFYLMKDGKPFGSKTSCYVTRVNGWEERMTKQLRMLWVRASKTSRCKFCGKPKAVFTAKKTGNMFQACSEHFGKTFEDWSE